MTSRTNALERCRIYVGAIASLLIACFCIYNLAAMTRLWWEARSWQAVEASFDIAPYRKTVEQDGKKSDITAYAYSYHYRVGGVDYTGRALTLGSFTLIAQFDEAGLVRERKHGQRATVWLNPRKPGQAVLERSFRWLQALAWLSCFCVAFGLPWYVLTSERNKPDGAWAV